MNEPRTLSEAIVRINAALTPLSWTDQLYGRVALIDSRKPGQDKAQLLPMLPTDDGDYIDCRPDDNRKSVIFYVATEPEKNDFDRARHSDTHAIRATRNVSLIAWLNLQKLGSPSTVDHFAEETRLQLKTCLKKVGCVVKIGELVDGPLPVVFKPFQVSDLDRKYDRWPFFCFSLLLSIMTIEQP